MIGRQDPNEVSEKNQNNTKSKLTRENISIVVGVAVAVAVLFFVIFFVILPTPVAPASVASTPVASTPVASTPVASTPVASTVPTNWKGYSYSTNGRCGPSHNNTACPDNQCCSTAGWCGTSSYHCAKVGTPESIYESSSVMSDGHFNNIRPTWSTENSVEPDNSGVPTNWKGYSYSTNGRCGPSHNNTACPDNQCCSQSGWCGTTNGHCARAGIPDVTLWQFGSISDGNFNDIEPTWSTV